MPVLSRAELERRVEPAAGDPLVVVSLCAAWCDVCRQFALAFARLADEHPQATFVWLDIEDDAELCGDVDVENFPTLAVFRGADVLHFGTTLPSQAGVARIVAAVRERSVPVAAPVAVADLATRIRLLRARPA